MNFEKVQRKNRKAISPVLATVILIAITLIAAIAIAGFVFGLFGSFTSSARISATSVTCASASGQCTVYLLNTGSSNAQATTSCSETYKGVVHAVTNATAVIVTSGAAAIAYTCTVHGSTSAGSAVTGSVSLSNGGQVPFSGIFS
jgi:flagellin-like protein